MQRPVFAMDTQDRPIHTTEPGTTIAAPKAVSQSREGWQSYSSTTTVPGTTMAGVHDAVNDVSDTTQSSFSSLGQTTPRADSALLRSNVHNINDTDKGTNARTHKFSFSRRLVRYGVLGTTIGLGMVVIAFMYSHRRITKPLASGVNQQYNSQAVSLDGVPTPKDSSLDILGTVSVNGNLDVQNAFVLEPTAEPRRATAGQLYYNAKTHKLSLFNGTDFSALLSGNDFISSIGNTTGDIGLGKGLSVQDNTLQNTGVTSIGNQTGAIALGSGLDLANGQLQNTGITSVKAGTNVAVTDDGNGTVTINAVGSSIAPNVSLNTLTGDITLQGTTGQLVATTTGSTITFALDSQVSLLGQNISDSEVDNNLTISSTGSVADGALSADVSLLGQSISNSELDNSSLTVTAGSGLTDGGSVALGSSTTLSIGDGSCITVNANDIGVTNDCVNATTLDGHDTGYFQTAGSYAPAEGSNNYIQNGTNPQSADFNITGDGTVGGALAVAGMASFSGNVTVASGKTLSIGVATNYDTYTPGSGFAPQVTYSVGDGPYSVVAAYLNNDSSLDVVSVNSASDTVSVRMNNGDGTFAAQSIYNVGDFPSAVATADVNGDNRPDIIAANKDDKTVSVLMNNGNGTFATQSTYPIGNWSLSIATADVNGDGRPDIIETNRDDANVSVLMNKGDGTFASRVNYAVGSHPYGVTAADVNGDNRPDIISANWWTNSTVSVLINNGNGTFATQVTYPVGSGAFSVKSADLNGDSSPDIVVTNYNDHTVSVLLNNGNGTFAAKTDYAAGNPPLTADIADIDGDGSPDIITPNFTDNAVSVLLNNGNGTFANQVTYAVGNGPHYVTAADLNNDGTIDILTANTNDDTISVLLRGMQPVSYGAGLSVTAASVTSAGQIIQGASGQVADLLRVQDSSRNALFVVDASGSVGVGVANPTTNLDVAGSINASTGYQTGGADGLTFLSCTNGEVLQNSTVQGGIVTGGGCATLGYSGTGTGSGVASVNNLVGDLTLQGTTNQLSAMSAGSTITFALDPQVSLLGQSIVSSEITDGTITGTDIQDSTIQGVDIADNTVTLGTKTTGNYVAGITAGTGITVSGTAGEGWSPTVSLDPSYLDAHYAETSGSDSYIQNQTATAQNASFKIGGTATVQGDDADALSVQNSNSASLLTADTSNMQVVVDGGHQVTFVKTLGGTGADSTTYIAKTSDGGYAVTAVTNSYGSGGYDMLLAKYDSSDTLEWSKTWGGTGDDEGQSLIQTSDGGYAITGYTNSYGAGNYDMFLTKFDSSGTLLWSKTWGGTGDDRGRSVVQTSDGGYAITGYTTSFGTGPGLVFLVKYDSSGVLQWDKTWGGTGGEQGLEVIQTSDGGYAMTGYVGSYGAGSGDMLLIKYSSSGGIQWSKTWGGTGWDTGSDLIQTSDGGYAVTGWTNSFGTGGREALIVKFNSAGNVQWNKTWGGTGDEEGNDLTQTSDGGYVFTGYTKSFSSGMDVYLVKYDTAGNLLWNKTWNSGGDDNGASLTQTTDGGFIVGGSTNGVGAGDYDMLFIRYNSSGDITGCDSSMCQSPAASTSSPAAVISTPSTSSPSPAASVSSPSAGVTSPSPTTTVVVANTSPTTSTLVVNGGTSLNGSVAIGTTTPAYELDVAGDINSSTSYRIGGTSGSSVTCTTGQVLQNQVVQGGITTSGNCVSVSTGLNGTGTSGQVAVFDGSGNLQGTDDILFNTATASLTLGSGTLAGSVVLTDGGSFSGTVKIASGGLAQNTAYVLPAVSANLVEICTSAGNCVPNGTNPGDMLYWDGSKWTSLNAPTASNSTLRYCDSNPTWNACAPVVTTDSLTRTGDTSADLTGFVVNNDGAVVTARGIVYGTSPNPTLDTGTVVSSGNGLGSFSVSTSGLPGGKVYFRAYATNSAGTGYGNQLMTTVGVYSVGNVGPAGGIVFYDRGSYIDGWRFLESAPSGWNGTSSDATPQWGCEGTAISGADGTGLGTGKQNTADIMAGCSQAGIAARVATDYNGGGYSDWFLPSQDELTRLYLERDVVGGFAETDINNDYYFSSSEYDSSNVWSHNFASGNQTDLAKSNTTVFMRPIREF